MNLFAKTISGVALVVGLATGHSPAQTSLNLGRLPLCFEANHGQANAAASFIAHGRDSEFLISPAGAQFILRQTTGKTAFAQMQFAGANPTATISGTAELSGKANYLIGNNPVQWQAGVATFAQVRVENIYPGVNVVYYGNGRQLEYDFNLAAGIPPEIIALRFAGAQKISVNPQGALVVSLNGGEIIQHPPVVYQNIGATRQAISGGYKLLDAHTVTFALGDYDHHQPLVIDPILSYSTFFGGSSDDIAHAVVVDSNNNIYLAGNTFSPGFSSSIPTPGALQTNFIAAAGYQDVFIAKFDHTGSNLVYFTYLGGTQDQSANGLAVDAAGNAYVTGSTTSPNFPTKNARFGTIGGQPFHGYYPPDAFVSEINSNGTGLVYSTYLGGNNFDLANAIAVDAAGTAYLAGYTSSTNLPVTTNAFQSHLACTNNGIPNTYNYNAFVAEIAPGGTNLNYSSYLGGHNYDQATGIAVDKNGFIYVTGYTASTNFPTTNALASFQHLNASTNVTPFYDAFVSKFKPNFGGLVYSTFLGGINNDQANGIAADASGNAYVVGWTISPNFPGATTNDPGSCASFVANYLTNNLVYASATTNTFLTEISSNGTAILHTAVFGGLQSDIGNGIALATNGNIFVVGTTLSTNFPVTTGNLLGSLRATNSGGNDVFVTAFKSDWSGLLYSTYLGGILDDFGNAIAVDASGNAYITGQTFSTNYPSFNARQSALNGTSDAFLTKILPSAPTPLLATSRSGTNVLVTWPPVGEESLAFVLETTNNLLTTNAWTLVTNSPVFTNGNLIYKFSPTNRVEFFRLHKF